jgi:hypothetical protein
VKSDDLLFAEEGSPYGGDTDIEPKSIRLAWYDGFAHGLSFLIIVVYYPRYCGYPG